VPNLAILVSAVLLLSCGQTDRQTDRHTYTHRFTDATVRFTPATVVGLSMLNWLIMIRSSIIIKFRLTLKGRDQN